MQNAELRMQKRGAARVALFILNSAFCILHSAFASDFKAAAPGYEFQFPRDHGSHPEYQTEWWYYTGHLRTESGRRFGFEVTFFRTAVEDRRSRLSGQAGLPVPHASRWDLRHLMPAHFAVTDAGAKAFRYYEKLNRASVFTANAAEGRLDVFNEA